MCANYSYDFPIFRDWMKRACASEVSGAIFSDLLGLYTTPQVARWTQYLPDGAGVSDFKLHLCVRPWQTVSPLSGPVQTTELVPVQKAYETNLNRVHAFMVFAPAIVNTTKILTEIKAAVILEHRDKILSKKMPEADVNALIHERIMAHADQRALTLSQGGKPAQELLQKELNFGFEAMNNFLKDELASAAHAWLSAQLTGIWTAFEAMAEELWVAALNAHPRVLAELKGLKKGTGDEKKVDLYLLQMNNYDLSKRMGDVLRRRYSFDKLDDIRKAYADAFSEDAQDIKDVIDDRALDALALTRHVIIHNGGIIDAGFLKRKNDLPAAIIKDIGDPLPLDGEITATLTAPVMQLGWALIQLVDRWVAQHPN